MTMMRSMYCVCMGVCVCVCVSLLCVSVCVCVCVCVAVTEAGKVGNRLAKDFFREEYILNHLIGEVAMTPVVYQ